MSGVETTGNFPRALWPGVNSWFGGEYKDLPGYWQKMFQRFTSKQAYEIDVQEVGLGAAQVKDETQSVSYDSMVQGYESVYRNVAYALGIIISHEEIADNLYMQLGQKRSKGLARAFGYAKEINAATIYNNAFSSATTYGDGVSLLNTAHPRTSGGTFANKLAVDADLSDLAIEDLLILLDNAINDRGFYISLKPKDLIIAPANRFVAERILKSTLRPGTGNNDTNVAHSYGLGQPVVNPYLNSNPRAWFITTDCPDSLKYFEREALSFDRQNDFDTKNFKAAAYERYVFGCSDPRGLVGSDAP